MNYKSYQHIEKLGNSEVDGILDGIVYVSYKIDGTNACIWLKDDGTLGFGSRKREVTIENDNQSFVKELCTNEKNKDIYEDIKRFLEVNPTMILYGEWLVCSTLKTYKDDAWKQFYVFDVYDTKTEKYVPYDIYKQLFDVFYPNIKYIPTITVLKNPEPEELVSLLDKTGDWLIKEGLGEGIVIKNYEYTNRFGRKTWAKILTEDFKKTKHNSRKSNHINKEEHMIEYDIVKLLTREHILKEKNKLIEKYNGEWNEKHIFELLNVVFTEFFKDNWEIILKKFHNPTINFKVLKQLCNEKVKEFI